MKKSQRLRLATLAAKDAAALTAEEKTELATLQALAATHPDASKDTDDTPAAAAAAPTARTVLAAAFNSLRGNNAVAADLATAQQTIRTLTSERDTARTDLAACTTERDAVRTELAAARGQVTAFASFFGLTAAELAAADGPKLNALLETKISALAVDTVNGLGIPVAQLPKQGATESGAAETEAELHEQIKAEKDPKRQGELAARANALRDKRWGRPGNN